MKKACSLFVAVLFVGGVPLSAYADGPISIDVPNNCTVIDSNGVSHVFPQSDSPSEYLGICMLEAAKEAELADFTVTNDPSLGLYIQSVNSIAPGATEYWAIWSNGVMAACGIGCTPLSQGDTLSLILTDWMTNVESTTVAFNVRSLVSPPPPPPEGGRTSGSSGGIPHSRLSVADALAYLASRQREDGSFGSPLLSDWVAIAFAAADPGDAKARLREYLRTATPALSSVTDYERHAMALLALGINPYSGTPVDYITPIVSSFDGTQIGDASLSNDDIFALFPLLSAGYRTSDAIIQKTIAFILSRQRPDGSWDGSVDLAAAAIQALVPARMFPDVSLALIRAEGYLRKEQPSNSFSTSWVRQAMGALSWTPSGWTQNAFTKEDSLALLQQADGGIEPESSSVETRVWATAYAIPAALGQSWPMLLQSFERPAAAPTLPLAASTTPSLVATSTLPVASSTKVSLPAHPAKTAARAEAPVMPQLPVLTENQTAAVANAPSGVFFIRLWNSFFTFFSSLL